MKKFILHPSAFILCLLLAATATLSAADISITAANVVPSSSATKIVGTAGATITAGQTVYLDTTTSTYKLADANASAATALLGGLALTGAASGQPVVVLKRDPGLTLGGTVASGATVILSATAGGVAPVADAATGWYVTVLGVGTGSNKINFTPVAGGAVP